MAPFTMQSLLLLLSTLLSIASAQVSITLDIPPYEPLGSSLPIVPEYYGPREVTIYNPNLLKGIGRRATSKLVDQPSSGLASAVYTMANIPDNINVVMAYPLFANGSINSTGLQQYYPYYDGSYEYVSQFTATGSVYQDSLDSQSSMVQAGSRLFHVNAGSNTFTQWAINCSNPAQLFELGTVEVNGQYPNTLAVAVENQIVCVGTTGEYAGIECYTYDVGFGPSSINPPQYFTGTNVTLPLPIEQAAGVPAGPPDTLSQLIFTDDENYLVAIVKSAANSDLEVTSEGYINVYPISGSGLGQPVQTTVSGTKFLFGCTFLYNTYDLFCADSGVGTAYLSIDSSSLAVTLIESQSTPASSINPTSMNCWTARSPYSNGPFYASAVNENYIAAFTQSNGKYLTTHNFTNSNPQLIEMATANSFVYALTFGAEDSEGITNCPTITVARDTTLAGGFQQEQLVELIDYSTTYEGMAVFVPSDESNVCDFN